MTSKKARWSADSTSEVESAVLARVPQQRTYGGAAEARSWMSGYHCPFCNAIPRIELDENRTSHVQVRHNRLCPRAVLNPRR